MTKRGLASGALGLALLVQGCAGLFAKEPAETGSRPPAPAAAPSGGTFEVEKGRPGFVIAAPHGTSDAATDVIGRDLARLTGFSLVVVTGYTQIDALGRRYNVNRPTESVPGSAARLEVETAPAREVYQVYRRRVAEAAQGPLKLYVEVHGNARPETAVLADGFSCRTQIQAGHLGRDGIHLAQLLAGLIGEPPGPGRAAGPQP